MNAHSFIPIGPFRRVASIGAAIMIGAATLGSPSGLAKMIPLKMPDEFDAACRTVDPGAPLEQRTKAFWEQFDGLLYHAEIPEVVNAESGEWPKSVLPAWIAYADAAPGARAQARMDWLAKLQTKDARSQLTSLSMFQLKLFRCFFPAASPTGFDGDEVTQAFEALALGRDSPANDPMRGRMDFIGGWVAWYAFADGAAEMAYTSNDRLAWETLRRMSLYGLLLHAHHDTRPCPGAQCQRAPQVKPTGLASTDMVEIKRFVGAADTAAAELEAYGMLKAQDPKFLAKVLVPQAGAKHVARAKPAVKTKTLDDLEKEVEQLKNDLGNVRNQADQSDNTITTMKSRYDFVVIAFFDFPADPKKEPPELAALKKGETSGLPTIQYNWECNPCYKLGNMHWLTGLENSKVPAGFKWTYIATKVFATPHEAEAWLANSEEGQFIAKYAKVVMRTTVTGYSPY